jgi:hypothetical protein
MAGWWAVGEADRPEKRKKYRLKTIQNFGVEDIEIDQANINVIGQIRCQQIP